ncbi:amino acid deaminase [Rhodococcus koreensis]
MIGFDDIDVLHDRPIDASYKSLPASAWGLSVRDFLATTPRLSDLQTPIVTLDAGRMQWNQAVMTRWCRRVGVEHAPHGKTTMSPQLWRRQLDSGAWAITLATGWQVQIARKFGIERILLANELVDPVALRWIHDELHRDHTFEFYCWADAPETVTAMNAALDTRTTGRRIGVLIDVGATGGRTGARTPATALATAEAIARSPHLYVAGIAGWEGVLGRDRSPAAVQTLHSYLEFVTKTHADLRAGNYYEGRALVSAGGSAFPDIVVEHLAPLADAETLVVLRSGCYLVHDNGFYADLSPFTPDRAGEPLQPAIHGWARTLSRPEPHFAVLDAGRRDVPYDAGLPVPQHLTTGRAIHGTVTALNDQHTFLTLNERDENQVEVGSVVRLGLSHPCTAFDKWKLIPVIDDADSDDPLITDAVHTFF